MIIVSERIARWTLKVAEQDPTSAFDLAAPYYCHVCGDATAKPDQKKHLNAHRRELERITSARRRAALAKAQAARRAKAPAARSASA